MRVSDLLRAAIASGLPVDAEVVIVLPRRDAGSRVSVAPDAAPPLESAKLETMFKQPDGSITWSAGGGASVPVLVLRGRS